LTKDDDGQWTGGWTTDEDGFDLDILEEDMGLVIPVHKYSWDEHHYSQTAMGSVL